MIVRFRAQPHDQVDGRFPKRVGLNFFDPNDPQAGYAMQGWWTFGMLGINFDSHGIAHIYHGANKLILRDANRDLNLRDAPINTVRLIRANCKCEIYFNGKRVLYAPTVVDAPPAVDVKSVDMNLTIKSIEAVELVR